MHQTVEELRKEIDEIDDKVVRLLEKRVNLAERIIKKKREIGENKHSPNRENQIKERLNQQSSLPKNFVVKVYEQILESVRSVIK